MRLFILGGTGFIGYHVIAEGTRRGHRVASLSLPGDPPVCRHPHPLIYHSGDFNRLSDEALVDLLAGHEGVVFAMGVDDRVVRFCFAKKEETLVAAAERLRRLKVR